MRRWNKIFIGQTGSAVASGENSWANTGVVFNFLLRGRTEGEVREKRRAIEIVKEATVKALGEMLQDIRPLTVELKRNDDLVSAPRPFVEESEGGVEYPVLLGDSIRSTFEQSGRSLLVAGGGGFGKTTLLSKLCIQLCDSELQDQESPSIPILLNLGSWREEDSSLDGWMIREFPRQYKMSSDLLRGWLDEGAVILVLDGLDENPRRLTRRIVEAVNIFIGENLTPIAVGCRASHWPSGQIKLNLSCALEIQRQRPEAVVDYLTELKSRTARAVSEVPHTDKKWWDLVSTPLMLGIISRISRYEPDADLVVQGSIRERREHLIERYVTTMLNRRRSRRYKFGPEVSREWLLALASWMNSKDYSELYIDRLGADLIGDLGNVSKIKNVPTVIAGGAVSAGLVASGVTGLILPESARFPGYFYGFIPSFAFGALATYCTVWSIRKHHGKRDRPIFPVAGTFELWRKSLTALVIASLLGYLLIAATALLSSSKEASGSPLRAVLMNLLFMFPVVFSLDDPDWIPDEAGIPPGERMRISKRNAAMAALFLGVGGSVLLGIAASSEPPKFAPDYPAWTYGVGVSINFGIVSTVNYWLIFGGAPFVQYREVMKAIERGGYGPRNYLGFLNRMQERMLLYRAGSAYIFPHRDIQEYLARKFQEGRGLGQFYS